MHLRKINFIRFYCCSKSHVTYLPQTISVLSGLLRDSSPQVIKRVIQACASIYRNMLKWLCTLDDIFEATETAWNTLCIMKAEMLDMLDHENDGIRTNAIKFLEGIVILQTYPDEDSLKRPNDMSLENIPLTMKIVRRRKLEDEAINIFEALLKMQATSHISSVNLIACTGSLCTIAKVRPNLMGPVVDAIKTLITNLPPTLTDSQVNSVRKHLKVQFINILRQPSAFEQHSNINHILSDLGATNQEIQRAMPKLDRKEQARRAKRASENALAAAAKRVKIEKPDKPAPAKREMEVDYEELEEQKRKSNEINENALLDQLKLKEKVVELVVDSMQNLPGDMPPHFMRNYAPVVNYTTQQRVAKVAKTLSELMTIDKLGPGANAFTKDTPMRIKVTAEEEKSIVLGLRREPAASASTEANEDIEMIDEDEEEERTADDEPKNAKEMAQNKLRENMERAKREQSIIPRMKQKAKSLKLQEITKPMSKAKKETFLLQAVLRILKAEKQSIRGGVAKQRNKILTSLAATFTNSVRETIMTFILDDVKARLELAFSWLFEEYSLYQGFTRHSYIKSENKPDFAYNKLLNDLISGVLENPDEKLDKETILRRIYHESPIISDDAYNQLVNMCELTEYSDCAMKLLTELTVRRPPRRVKYLQVLLRFAVHENDYIRAQAIDNLLKIYAEFKMLNDEIEMHAVVWLSYLEKPEPQMEIFGGEYGREETAIVWTDTLSRNCMAFFLALLPYHEGLLEKLAQVYVVTPPELKRTILRSIEAPIKKMGAESFYVLKVIEDGAKGTETLITRIIYILTEKTTPNHELVNRVRHLYHTKLSDVRLLIPVLTGLTRSEIIVALPELLLLKDVIVKEVLNRLLGLGQYEVRSLPLSATELLVALHQIDIKKEKLKCLVNAITMCLKEKDCYTQDILAIVLQQLVEVTPLPTLLMRTILQSLTLYPRMATFVNNLLQRLIPKQVWRQKVLWEGFLKCCQRLRPASFPVMLTLPPQQLQDALNQHPELRKPLVDYANEAKETQGLPVSKLTMDILLGNSQDVIITVNSLWFLLIFMMLSNNFSFFYFDFLQEVSGLTNTGIISTDNIKKEFDDSEGDPAAQPLPPGDER